MVSQTEIWKAQESREARDALICREGEWISRCASRAAGRWVSREDEIYADAMIAFDNAVMAYRAEKGPFEPFAAKVIANRVTDHLRSCQKDRGVIPLSAMEQENEEGEIVAFEVPDTKSGQEELRLEILSLRQELERFSISFFDLPQVSPKAKKTRAECIRVSRCIAEDPQLFEELFSKKQLPVRNLQRRMNVRIKLLERHRKYIIAGALICAGEYTALEQWFAGGDRM